MPLPPLEPAAIEALIEHHLPPGKPGEKLSAQIVERAEGNPFFAEEIARMSLADLGAERPHTWAMPANASADLPPAVESLLVARIDRLPAGARQLAQIAAVVGRDFSVDLVQQALAADDIDEELGLLLRAGIARELHRFPGFVCTFRHALLQEAALDTLTPAARRELYGTVAAAAEQGSTDQAGAAGLLLLPERHSRAGPAVPGGRGRADGGPRARDRALGSCRPARGAVR